MAIADLTNKLAWLRPSSLGAASSVLTGWTDESGLNRETFVAGTAPTVSATTTPLGQKAVKFVAGYVGIRGRITASSMLSTTYQPQWATDGTANYWHTAGNTGTHWWKSQTKDAQVATGYSITVVSSSGPGTWTFEGSNDNSTWDVLDTRSGVTWASAETKGYTFANSTAYKYYRFNVTVSPQGYLRWNEVSITGVVMEPEVINRNGELWIVVKTTTRSDNGAWAFSYSPGGESHYTYGGQVYDYNGGTSRPNFVPSGVTVTNWHVYCVTVAGTTRRWFLNNILQLTETTTPSWAIDAKLGQSNGYFFEGEVAELLWLGGASSSNQRSDIFDELYGRHIAIETPTIQVEASAAEVLTLDPPSVTVEASTAEALTRDTVATNVEAVGLEVLTRIFNRPTLEDLPLISQIRSEDHTDATSMTDRAGTAWSLHSGSLATITPGATPNGTKAFTFAGAGSYCRLSDPGTMYQGNDAEAFRASSIFNNSQQYNPANVGDATGEFACADGSMPCWWAVKLKAARVVTDYSIQHSGNGSSGRNANTWKFQGSNNSTTGADGIWTDLDSRTGQNNNALTTYSFTNTVAYRWYRIIVTAINGGQMWFMTRAQLGGVSLLGTIYDSCEQWLVIKATAAGSGHPVLFTSASDTRYPFTDNQIYTGWGAAGRYVYTPSVAIMNQWRIYRMVRSGGNVYEYLDKVRQLTGASGGFYRQPRIGTGGSVAFTGQIAASLIFGDNLSPTEADMVDTYLRDAYFNALTAGARRGWGITMN